MSNILRFPDLALGELEQQVLETLWEHGALKPADVHERVGVSRGISVNTVSSALKRLYEKDLLTREKISHSYVYSAAIDRAQLQRQLIGAIATQFSDARDTSLLAAFVDVAEAGGEDTLRELEALIARRLAEGKS